MHTLALHLTPLLAAEKSKVPFYIAGGLLVLWALVVSLAIGMRRSDFPANESQQRAVIAVTAVLVVAAASMAVVTSGGAKSTAQASTTSTGAATSAQPTTPTETSMTSSAGGAQAPSETQPTATTGAPTASAKVKVAADPTGQLAFNTKQLKAKAGTVTVEFTNGAPVEHNIAIAQGATVLGSTPTFSGGKRSLTLKLKPGTYTFYCTVPGHRQAGMEGTLTVS